jgi:hypothetical protein
MPSVIREIDWNNVGLITAYARQSAETNLLECGAAFILSHLVNEHPNLLVWGIDV